MVGKDSGVTLKEDWRQKAVSARKDRLCIWRNMFGDTIIEMLVFNDRKNSFLNHLKGAMFSGSFTTLPFLYSGNLLPPILKQIPEELDSRATGFHLSGVTVSNHCPT